MRRANFEAVCECLKDFYWGKDNFFDGKMNSHTPSKVAIAVQKLGDPLLGIIEEKDYDFDIDDEEALRLRSPILFIQTIETPVFLLHRAGNPIISGEEVIDFYKAMLEENKECYLSIIEKTPGKDEQILSYEEVLSEAESWVDSMMKLEH